MMVYLQFAVCTGVIVFAGSKLSYYGDIIAEKMGLGRTWIGVVFVSSVSSMPEQITGIRSVTQAGVPDIAVGDAVGS
jgi:cation:H+ antiporter